MTLIVSTRTEASHLRFEIDGRWQFGDALKLAYQLKAAQVRADANRLLVDLRRVTSEPDTQDRFLVCDRLLRVFAPPVRVALVGDATLIDSDALAAAGPAAGAIRLFVRESEALAWLLA